MAPLRIEQLASRTELVPVVAAWIYDEWWQEVEGASPGKLTDLLRGHLVPDQMPLTFVASVDTLPVGTVSLLAHDVGTEQWPQLSPWLAALYVVPEHRRQGIGAALVNAIVAQAGAMGRQVLYLLTTEREEFYSQLGWQVFDKTQDSTVMSRSAAILP
ncbi:MAG TPA: GNAT family N-acetyltransferase [Steroidobacteraceae bacterium]|nr:GNAT family N-acetyltransferase [Steroidobacteraceae bacterium]